MEIDSAFVKPKDLKITLFFDSGAYSAWRRGVELPVKDYIKFLRRHERLFSCYVNMDVIPGANGKMTADPDVVEKSAKLSYRNLQTMHDAGLEPIPVFHQGERWYWLEKLLKDGEPYIGISPYARANKSEVKKWLDHVFSLLCDVKGKPSVRTHGFGMTVPSLIWRYPWATVDSTSWFLPAGYGIILCPNYKDGVADYHRHAIFVTVTGRASVGAQGRNLEDWAITRPQAYESILRYIKECGKSIYEVRNVMKARYVCCGYFFKGLAASIGVVNFQHQASSFLNDVQSAITGLKTDKDFFKMIFACPPRFMHSSSLNECAIGDRLISYFDVYKRDDADEFLERYFETGLPGDLNPAKPLQHYKGVRGEYYAAYRRMNIVNRSMREDEA